MGVDGGETDDDDDVDKARETGCIAGDSGRARRERRDEKGTACGTTFLKSKREQVQDPLSGGLIKSSG